MSNSVICSAPELRIAWNKIERQLEMLAGYMREYTKILSEIQKNAIIDDRISAGLTELARELLPCIRFLGEAAGHDISIAINREISEIEAADTSFLYPHDLLYRISSMLAVFHAM